MRVGVAEQLGALGFSCQDSLMQGTSGMCGCCRGCLCSGSTNKRCGLKYDVSNGSLSLQCGMLCCACCPLPDPQLPWAADQPRQLSWFRLPPHAKAAHLAPCFCLQYLLSRAPLVPHSYLNRCSLSHSSLPPHSLCTVSSISTHSLLTLCSLTLFSLPVPLGVCCA